MPFVVGTTGYIGVVIMLIVSLQGSTILMVHAAWSGINALMGGACAYVFLGERFHNYSEYGGALFIIAGLFLLKIPKSKANSFRIPALK